MRSAGRAGVVRDRPGGGTGRGGGDGVRLAARDRDAATPVLPRVERAPDGTARLVL